jgi:hypothetical protein
MSKIDYSKWNLNRGWPTDDGEGFHPECNECTGHGSTYRYEFVSRIVVPFPEDALKDYRSGQTTGVTRWMSCYVGALGWKPVDRDDFESDEAYQSYMDGTDRSIQVNLIMHDETEVPFTILDPWLDYSCEPEAGYHTCPNCDGRGVAKWYIDHEGRGEIPDIPAMNKRQQARNARKRWERDLAAFNVSQKAVGESPFAILAGRF